MVAGVAPVVLRCGVATGGRGGGRRQGLGSGGGRQGPGPERNVEAVHAAAVHAGLDLVRAQVRRLSLHLDHPAGTAYTVLSFIYIFSGSRFTKNRQQFMIK